MSVIHVSVKQRHIEHGKRRHCRECPIALSFREMGYVVDVVGPYVDISKKYAYPRRVLLPNIAHTYLLEIDSGCRRGPIEFEVRDPFAA